MRPALGIDLGGTKLEIVALDDRGSELVRRRRPTPADYPATLEAIRDLIAATETELGTQGSVGIGTPGAISPASGLMKNANLASLNGRPLDRDVEDLLRRPVALANDADCFALSEATDGSGAGARTVFCVIIGTGVGGGIVVDGRLLDGPNAITGEWGHNPLPAPAADELPGPPCYCGRRGCLETWLSGPGLTDDHERVSGVRCDPPAIVRAAAAGDPAARATLKRHEERLARGLATVINLLDPDVIVLGGGLSRLDPLYTGVPARWAHHVFSDVARTRLARPLHGDSSGVRGAAWLGRRWADAQQSGRSNSSTSASSPSTTKSP